MPLQTTNTSDVVVVGGGIIGMSISWQLVKAGASVTVLEKRDVGGQATGAAAGMLAPLAEAKSAGPFVDLGLASLQMYPSFVSALIEETGLDPQLVGPGMLRVAQNRAEHKMLQHEFDWLQTAGLPMEWLEGEVARQLEPALHPDVRAAILSTLERHVEPKRLVGALAQACSLRGVRIMEQSPATGFESHCGRVTGVQTADGLVSCGSVVVAGGAWSASIADRLGIPLPVFPIRGQILALSCLPPLIRHTIYSHSGYLVPKVDGRVVVGATEDSAGFDARPTAAGVLCLLNVAGRIAPELADAPFQSAWAGLRPATIDGLPILGRLAGWENAHVATGHYRNGILLAPITGEIIAQSVLSACPHPLQTAFRADRYTPADFRGG